MPGVAIQGSICSGHDGFHPRPSIQGEPKFTVNGVPVMLSGHAFALHTKPKNPPHGGSAVGTSKLTVNGRPVAKIGDTVDCGSVIVTGQKLLKVT